MIEGSLKAFLLRICGISLSSVSIEIEVRLVD